MSPRARQALSMVALFGVLLLASGAEAGQGWYLMVPPRSEYNVNADFLQGYKIRSSEPLSQWGQQGPTTRRKSVRQSRTP
jgi:hypothetical protein